MFVAIVILAMSGCSSTTVEFDYFVQPLITRIDSNKALIEQLHEAKVMQDSTYNTVISSLDNKIEQLNTTKTNLQKLQSDGQSGVADKLNSDQNLRALLGAVQAYWSPDIQEAQTYGIEEDTFAGKVFPLLLKENEKYLYTNENGTKRQLYSRLPGATSSQAQKAAAFEILDAEVKEQIRLDELGKVYVLDMSKVTSLVEGGAGQSIDQLNKYMQTYIQAMEDFNAVNTTDIKLPDGTQITEKNFQEQLNKVFSPLTDSQGNEVCWLDLSQFDIIQDQILQTDGQSEGKYEGQGGLQQQPTGWKDECGYDVQVTNNIGGQTVTVAYIRVEELNTAQVTDLISAATSNTSSRMMVYNGNFYLFAYPIATVDEIALQDDSTYTIQYKVDNQVLVQFKSQQTLKVNGTTDTQTQTDQPYISVGDGTQADKQQFILSSGDLTGQLDLAGQANRDNQVGNQYSNNTVDNIPVFILRDYLEAQFTPGVINDGAIDEQIVCYGRLIRLSLSSQNNATYQLENPIGYYIDQDHNKIDSTGFQALYIHQFADADALDNQVTTGNSVLRLPQKLEKVDTETQGDQAQTQVAQLPVKTVQSIHPVLSFPGDLDAWDKDMQDKPQMYAIVTNLDLNQSGLLQHWITQDDEKLSLVWWQTWLNDHRYNYKLTSDSVNNWINAEYDIQLSDRDFVIFDLDKIDKQNHIFEQQENQKIVQTLRTFAMILGVIAEIYGAILVLAWTFDTQIGLGLGLLEKASLGHMTAIKYKDEGDYYQKDGPVPVTFSELIIKILIIAAVGGALLAFDISDLIAALLKIFKGVSGIIEQILTGLF